MVAVVASSFCVMPSSALAIGYGFSESFGTFNGTCPNNSCTQTYSYFRAGLGGSGEKYVRFFVPYDIIATARNGACDYDYWGNFDGNGNPQWEGLYDALVTAKAQGLTPMLSLGPGTATQDDSGNPLPDKGQNPTDLQYQCGFYYLVQTIDSSTWTANTAPVTDFEAYNEPENPQVSAGGVCGSTAAYYWEEALAQDQALGRSDSIVAGTFMSGDDPLNGSNHPDCGHPSGDWFVKDYVGAIETYSQHPAFWSWHPYIDVEAGYSGAFNSATTADMDSYINGVYSTNGWSSPRFWLTEAGVYLHGSDGAHLVGSASGQANAAEAFLNLQYAANQAYTGQIGRAYYYELQTYDNNNNDYDRFDSAPVAADWTGVSDGNPTNVSGLLRPSYCVLAFAYTPSQAASSSGCNNTIGFQQPSCGSSGPFNLGESQISEPSDVDWEDPCLGYPTMTPTSSLGAASANNSSAAPAGEEAETPAVPVGDPSGSNPPIHRQVLTGRPPAPPAGQGPPEPRPYPVAANPTLTCTGSPACIGS